MRAPIPATGHQRPEKYRENQGMPYGEYSAGGSIMLNLGRWVPLSLTVSDRYHVLKDFNNRKNYQFNDFSAVIWLDLTKLTPKSVTDWVKRWAPFDPK
jgi:hypothetical protein